ncbi:MAG: phage terminase large subunit [Gammaproteobacteria bacterium]|nr:phage terminase large subunit [Gammaproteobacteria bacterium]
MRSLSRGEFRRELHEALEQMRQAVAAAVEGFAPDAAARAERVRRSKDDLRFFARTYFPHFLTIPAESAMHRWLFDALPRRIDCERGTRTALAAPRGEGKSVLCSLVLPLWALLTGRKRFCVLLSDVSDQAQLLLAAIKAELEANPRLAMDRPDSAGAGPTWRDGVIVMRSGQMVRAYGSGQRVRGIRHGPHRPDLVIADDLENDVSVRSLEQRKQLKAWWQSAVLKLGGPKRDLDAVAVGTLLHHDGLLRSLMDSSLWESAKFRAIERWPDDMDAWEAFEEVLEAEGEEAAMRFHAHRRDLLDAGAELSWPEGGPLVELMMERAADPAAFAKERQNEPAASPDNVFAGCVGFWHDAPRQMVTVGAVDPSLGGKGRGADPSAILVGGIDATFEDPRLHVLEARIRKRKPEAIIGDVIAAQSRHACFSWAFEAVQFQEYCRQELVRQSAAKGSAVPARGTVPHTDKRLRIESIQPHLANGLILLHRSQTTLIEQLEHYPDADHDDGPDALEMLWREAQRFLRRRRGGGIATGAREDFDGADLRGF